jgi:nitrogenase molybdenum-iron protein NifN
MDTPSPPRKSCTVNPLKLSPSLGGAMAFLGIDGSMPMLHGAQGCTAFGLVLLVRHFREMVPFQTTAMNEVTTILGGADNLEQAIVNVTGRAHPKVVGICTTGLTETRGEDVRGDLKAIRAKHPELNGTALIYAQTPDYQGGIEDGWSAAVLAMIDELVEPEPLRDPKQINILAGSQLTPADIEEIREIVEAFGLIPIILPDISGSLDGHVEDRWVGTTSGGTTIDDIRRMSRSVATLAIGRQMEKPARLLERRCGVSAEIFSRLTGLGPCDTFVEVLMRISGKSAPASIRRQRSRLIDAMLDGHFYFGGKKVAAAADPDLLLGLSRFMSEMGTRVTCAVSATTSPALADIAAERVLVGDLDDVEQHAGDCDLLIANTHGRRVAERLGVPLYCAGMPITDRLGAGARLSVGYRGTRALIFDIANLFIAADEGHTHTRHGQGDPHATLAAC